MKRFLILTWAICLCPLPAFNQVNGKITERTENADTLSLPGATIFWENTSISTISDANGAFSLKTSPASSILIIQAIGFEQKKIIIRDTNQYLLLILKSGSELAEVDIVYYSTGTEISYLNTIKVETLGERSLMKAACCNLSESFETNPSIDVSFSDAISGTKQIQMLGLSGQYAQITKENMPYLRGLAGAYGLTFIPGTWIQSIQLSKGAGSVVNGYESFTGQINTELQNPASSDRLNFNSYVNENARNEYNLNLSQKLNSKWAAGVLSHYSRNPLVQDLNGDGFADIPTGEQINVMNKYSYADSKSGFEAQFGGAFLKDSRIGGQFPALIPGSDSIALYRIGIRNQKTEVYSKTGFVFKKMPGHSVGLQLSYLDHQQDNSFGTRPYQGDQKTFYANLIYQGIIGNTNRTYKIGGSFLYDQVHENFLQLVFHRKEMVPGVFAEYSYNFKEKFNLIAGIRADKSNYYGLFATPRLHVRYAFTPSSVLRFSGGRALRTPAIFSDNASLMASSRNWMLHNQETALPYGLQPEIGWNVGLNYTLKFKINYREAYITTDLYRTEFKQQVVIDLDREVREIHIGNLNGKSFSNTIQFEFNMEPRKRLFLKTAYRFVDTRVHYSKGLLQKPYVSRHRGFINLSYELRGGHWQFDFTTQYNGAKRLPDTSENPTAYQRDSSSPAFFNLLGQITWIRRIHGHFLNIYVGVENLLNYKQPSPIVAADVPYSRYFDASMVWGPIYGRMIYAGLRYRIK